MTIKIEVEASNIDELADKLLALGGRLSGNGVREAVEAMQVKPEPAKRTTRKSAEKVVEETSAPSVDETTEPTAAEPDETTTAGTSTSNAPAAAETPSNLDWDKDVAPKVIGFVKAHGREFVAGVLEQFGVDRASQLPEDRWPELLTALADASEQVAG